tara:strand:- start:229 stop:1611 length:1383 start_codon:yes stop_codon:yes gene_type:complete
MELGATTIFNEDGADVDFRIEGDTEANLFYVDAGNDRIGIGTNSPATTLQVDGKITVSSTLPEIFLTDTNTSNARGRLNANGGSLLLGADNDNAAADSVISFAVDGGEKARIDSDGRMLFGATSGNSASARAIFRGFAGDGGAGQGLIHLEVNKDRASCGANETLGSIRLGCNNGQFGAQISASAESQWGSGDLPTFLRFSLCPDGSSSLTERMRIDSAGRVMIGATSYNTGNMTSGATGINVAGASPQVLLHNTSQDKDAFLGMSGANLYLFSADSIPIVFGTSDAERMRIDSSGHIFMSGMTSLSAGTSVKGISFENSTNNGRINIHANSSAGTALNIAFFNSANHVGSINTTSSSTSYGTSSDYRLKENVTAISDGITRLKTLKPYRFNFKSDASTIVDGFFAHEVTAVPEAITGTKDEVDSDNNPVYQEIDQSKLVPLLVAAVKELITKVEALEAA